MATKTYRLPWPPSVNCYIRRGNNRSYMTKQGKRFREEVIATTDGGDPFTGRLAVAIELTAPDKRKRDIDNHVKPVLDALQHGNVFLDDSQVDLLRVARCHTESPGCCDVTITELEGA
jgi:crossover junction endodeoxyribonuclease RusA